MSQTARRLSSLPSLARLSSFSSTSSHVCVLPVLQEAINNLTTTKSSSKHLTRSLPSLRPIFKHSLTTGCNDISNRSFSTAGYSGGAFEDALSSLPKGAQLQLDFFGEPVTFLGVGEKDNITNAMAALDGFVLAIVSKGKTCIGGGEEEGLDIQSKHSSAIAWSELLRHATVWNNQETLQKAAPMLVVAGVAPILAQGAGVGYIRHIDNLLQQVDSGVPGLECPLQMLAMAQNAASMRENSNFNARERQHLKALHYMLKNRHLEALCELLELLRSCPGDVLALSLVMDLASTVGDSQAALSAAGSIAAYWNERRGGIIRPAIPGYAISCAYQALGFAVGGRYEEAEELATRTMNKGKSVCGGVSTWALTHCFDGQGRTAEGISFLANHDGVRNYEGSGFLFFQSRLATYGARYSLDREERGRGQSAALRLYESSVEWVLEYSGFGKGQAWKTPQRKSPIGWVYKPEEQNEQNGISSFLSNIFGAKKSEKKKRQSELVVKKKHLPSMNLDEWEPNCEDILTWLPPTPQLLSDATLLMWRMTLNGTISTQDHRWDNLRNAWKTLLQLYVPDEGATGEQTQQHGLEYAPLMCMSASILVHPELTGGEKVGTGRLASGLYMMGELMQLGDVGTPSDQTDSLRVVIAEKSPDFWLPVTAEEPKNEWKVVVDHLISALDGYEYDSSSDFGPSRILKCDLSFRFRSWTFDARPLVEHAVVYAACKAGDLQSLSRARSICSQGVTLRPNSPEEWWRYSVVLGILGDEVASEDALAASVNLGAGQGARSS